MTSRPRPSSALGPALPSASVKLHLGGYAQEQPSGLGRVPLSQDGFGEASALAGPKGPSWVVPLPDGRLLTVAEGDPGEVVLTDGEHELARAGSGGGGPCHLALSPDGRRALVSNYVSGTVGLLELGDGDGLTLVADLQLEGEGPHERQDSSHAHQATFLTDGHALVCDLGADRVWLVQVGDSLEVDGEIALPPGTGPRHLALHPSRDDLLWVVGELDQSVHPVRRDDRGWQLGQAVTTAPDGPAQGETTTAGIVVSPAGDRVYVSTRGTDTVTVFEADPEGRLVLRSQLPTDHWPRFIGWVPGHEGELLLVAAERAGTVRAYAVSDSEGVGADAAAGLADTGAQLSWPGVTWVG